MNIDVLKSGYFQKSQVYIYPLVNLYKDSAYLPNCTYLSWKGVYETSDNRLIAKYVTNIYSVNWKNFLTDILYKNPFFEDYSHTPDGSTAVVVFNMTVRKDPFNCVVNGKYSKIDSDMSSLIMCYYGVDKEKWMPLRIFLFVKMRYCWDNEDVQETIEAPDMDKECLVLETKNSIAKAMKEEHALWIEKRKEILRIKANEQKASLEKKLKEQGTEEMTSITNDKITSNLLSNTSKVNISEVVQDFEKNVATNPISVAPEKPTVPVPKEESAIVSFIGHVIIYGFIAAIVIWNAIVIGKGLIRTIHEAYLLVVPTIIVLGIIGVISFVRNKL